MAQPNTGGPITSTPSVPGNNNYDATSTSSGQWRKPMHADPASPGHGWRWADDIPDANVGSWRQV